MTTRLGGWGRLASIFVLALGLACVAAGPAWAATPSNPILGDGLTDSSGVPLEAYAALPLPALPRDAEAGDAMTRWLTEVLWTWHLTIVSMAVGLLDWMFEFTWVEWIVGPIAAVSSGLRGLVERVQWAPVALAVAAAISGIVAFRGRLAAGLAHVLVAAGCFALSVTILADPLGLVFGADPASVLAGAGATAADGIVQEMRGDARPGGLTQSVIDVAVRDASHEVAFGHRLDAGGCGAVFTAAATTMTTLGDRHELVDAVAACDADAAAYAAEAGPWQPATLGVVMFGSSSFVALVLGGLLALVAAIITALLAAMRVTLWVHLAILPGAARRKLVDAAVDLVLASAALAVLVGVLAAGAGLVVRVLDLARVAGTPLVVQCGFAAVTAVAAALVVWRIRARMSSDASDIAGSLGRLIGPSRSSSSSQLHAAALPARGSSLPAGSRLVEARPAVPFVSDALARRIGPIPEPAVREAASVERTAWPSRLDGPDGVLGSEPEPARVLGSPPPIPASAVPPADSADGTRRAASTAHGSTPIAVVTPLRSSRRPTASGAGGASTPGWYVAAPQGPRRAPDGTDRFGRDLGRADAVGA